MALKWFEGFNGSTAIGDFTAASPNAKQVTNGAVQPCTLSAGSGRNGEQCLRRSDWARSGLQRALGASYVTGVVGFAFKFSAFPTGSGVGSGSLVSFTDSGTTHFTVGVTSGGAFQLFRNIISSNVPFGSSAASGMTTGTWYYIEIKLTIDDTVGSVEIRVDGVAKLNQTGLDTRNGATASFNTINWGPGAVGSTGGANIDMHDVYFCDTTGSYNHDFLGDCRVVLLRPTSNGTTNNFTPLSGANWQNVDDTAQDAATTRNTTSTIGHIDLYNFDPLGLTLTPRGLQIIHWSARNGGSLGQVPNTQTQARINSTNYNGTTKGQGGNWAMEMYELSPDTSAAWTVTEIDNAEFGLKFVAGGSAASMYISQHFVEILLAPATLGRSFVPAMIG